MDEIQGSNVAEVAAPQSTVTTEQDVDTGVSTVQDTDTATAEQSNAQKPTQSHEDNAIAQAARKEAATALKAEREKFARTTQLAKTVGKIYDCFDDNDVETNFGSQGIHNLEQLAAEHERQTAIQQTGIDPKAIESIVDKLLKNNPAVKAAEAAQAEATKTKWISELKTAFPDEKIDENDPNLGLDKEVASQMGIFINRGFSPVEAYVQANWKSIQSKSTAAGKQAALNSITSKGHIQPTGGSADTSNVNVPPEVMKQYKIFNPKMTDEQAKKHYAKSLKEGF